MWEQITTLSEIDTITAGTFLCRENPDDDNETDIYRVIEKTDDSILLNTRISREPKDMLRIRTGELFDDGWWMLKAQQ